MSIHDALWVVLCAIFVLEMQAGFLCLEAGAVRTKNAANVALKNLSDICVVSVLFWGVGYAFMHGPEGNGFFAWGTFFPDFSQNRDGENAFFLFQLAFAATAATIVSGAVAERERFKAYALLSLLMASLAYPVAGHWIWGGAWAGSSEGWLYAMGFVDFAGATAVHSLGGWAALAVIVVLGPRLGRFGRKARWFEEHSIALSALGTVLLWIGWGAFNGGSAILFDLSIPTILIHTMLTAAFGGVAALCLSMALDRYIRTDRVMNGVLAGLVAGTAGIHLYDGAASAMVGILGAVSMVVCSELLDYLKIDDVVGAVPVHLAAGVAGTLAVAVFAPPEALPAGGALAQLQVQVLGVAAVGLWVLGLFLPAAYLLHRLGALRARPREEVVGLNLAENRHSNAFQELLTHMRHHSRHGDLSRRVPVERSTEAGALALRYNRVLKRVQAEASERMGAVERERKQREEAVWAARHDRLTGLGNRTCLEQISNERDPSARLVVAIDLDRFKDANDAYGHEAGDTILQACATRLKLFLRSGNDHAMRVGGDEFVLVLALPGDTEVAAFLCDAVLDALVRPVCYGTTELRVGASIGHDICAAEMPLRHALKNADLALYEAKRGGRNQVVAYRAEIGAIQDDRMSLIEDFKVALERHQIAILMQPQVDARTRDLSGVEVLARWAHPTRGLLAPNAFIPIATELKLLSDLDRRILDLALDAREHLEGRLGRAVDFSVNVSGRRLLEPGLMDELAARANLPATGLSFEILETTLLEDVGDVLSERVQALKAMGICVEVDDFGTGHASFASVLALKPDRLKIDGMFVEGVDHDPGRRDLMSGIIDMARHVGAETVIEGVETPGQADALTALGVDFLQGFLFARPLDMVSFEAWLRDHRGTSRAAV